jgi:hypothetical protein
MKRRLTVAGILLSFFAVTLPVQAQATRSISASVASGEQQITTVNLYSGHSITLNFRPTGEPIRRVWLDNPSQVTIDFDDPNCAVVGESGACAASIIHLRRIEPLHFPNLPIADSTSLTVVTDKGLYKFQLVFPKSGTPEYYTLNIQPDALDQSPTARSPLTLDQLTGQQGAQLIERGLSIAQVRGLVTQADPLWQRTQAFLSAIKQGAPPIDAASAAGISSELVLKLAELGLPHRAVDSSNVRL